MDQSCLQLENNKLPLLVRVLLFEQVLPLVLLSIHNQPIPRPPKSDTCTNHTISSSIAFYTLLKLSLFESFIRSVNTAPNRIAPKMAFCQYGDKPNWITAFDNMCISTSPKSPPIIVPSPPDNFPPPITTAAITRSVIPSTATGLAAFNLAAVISPINPANKPKRM